MNQLQGQNLSCDMVSSCIIAKSRSSFDVPRKSEYITEKHTRTAPETILCEDNSRLPHKIMYP